VRGTCGFELLSWATKILVQQFGGIEEQ